MSMIIFFQFNQEVDDEDYIDNEDEVDVIMFVDDVDHDVKRNYKLV